MSLPITPKRSMGQNFLTSKRVVEKIIDAADPTAGDIIVEIGPGLGAITENLLVFAGKVIAIEKDDALVEILKEKFGKQIASGAFDLVHSDVTDFDPEVLRFYQDFPYYKVAANIPYNLTGLIIRKFLSGTYQPVKIVLLIQKEVAERIVVRDGKESLLSLSVKAYGKPKIESAVARGNFNPVPRVDSAIISISDISRDRFKTKGHEELFFKLIHAGFGHKRKMLVRNMLDEKIGTKELWEQTLAGKKLPATIRAEKLSIDDWLFITNVLYNHG